jgi:hypothetical protein
VLLKATLAVFIGRMVLHSLASCIKASIKSKRFFHLQGGVVYLIKAFINAFACRVLTWFISNKLIYLQNA